VGVEKVQGKVLHSIWVSGGMAPRKILEALRLYFSVLLQIKLSSYTCNFEEINYDCSIIEYLVLLLQESAPMPTV